MALALRRPELLGLHHTTGNVQLLMSVLQSGSQQATYLPVRQEESYELNSQSGDTINPALLLLPLLLAGTLSCCATVESHRWQCAAVRLLMRCCRRQT